jgi:hypothetical protein
MLKQCVLPALLFLVLLGFGGRPAFADIYKYVNEQGEISFADNLESVPERYRATVVNVTPLEDQNQVQQPQTEQPVQPGTRTAQNIASTQERMTFTTRLFMTVVLIFVSIVVLVAINKTGSFKGRAKVLPAVRIALACLLLVYLVMAHGKDVTILFTMAGNKIGAVKEKQAQRGKKAGEAIKAFNTLMEAAGKQPPPSQEEEQNN